MQEKPSPKQEKILKLLENQIKKHGRTPSLRQLAQHMEISHAAVAQLLAALEEKGYIRREGRYSRTIHLLQKNNDINTRQYSRSIPIVGRVAAGLPMYAQQQYDGNLIVDKTIYGQGKTLFALRVNGDSMTEAAILDGDLVVCEARQYATSGEIVVALVHEEEATVKRFFLHDGFIELRPANPAYQPIYCGFEEVLIQGKVIGVQRGPESFS